MSFKLGDFIAAPSQELLNLAKKSDLLDIASHYSIPDVKTSMLKREIKNVIIQFLVDEEFFEPSATSLIMVSQTDIQLKELELKRHLELEKLRLEFEEKRRADKEEREERMHREKLELEKQKLVFEREEKQKQREMEERLEKERLEKQRELEERLAKEKIDMEEREKAKQREMEEREKEKHREMLERVELEKEKMHYEIKMKELELSSKSMPPVSFDPSKVFDVTKHIRLVPPFQEKEVDKYFLHFEKVAENLKWPKEHWTLLLQSVVIGKAREIYTQLPLDQSSDYDTVKNLILKAYELVPEAYRQKFRNCRKEHDQTHVEFARTKEQLFDRWCSSKDVKSDHAKLRQLMLVEEFKRCIHSDVKSFLDEREVETLDVAARLADHYTLTHKSSFIDKRLIYKPHYKKPYYRKPPYKKPFNPQFKPNTPQSKPFNPQQRNNSPQPNPQPQAGLTADSSSPSHNPKNKDTSENKGQRSSYSPRLFCNYCKGDGHVISECETLKRRKERQNQNNSRPMDSLNHDNQADVIEAFNSTSRYLDDLLNIDNPYFEGMVNQIYPPELQLNKANISDTEAPFLDLHLSVANGFVSSKIYDKRDDFDFDIVNFPFLDGDVPRRASYGVYISQLIRFARVCNHVTDFNARNKCLTAKLLQQGYRYHKLRKTFSKFYRRHYELISKYNVGLKTLLSEGLSEPEFYGDLVYKFKKLKGINDFSFQFRKIITRYKRIGYNLNVMRQSACLVFNPIMVDNYAAFFNCTPVGRASDSMMAPT